MDFARRVWGIPDSGYRRRAMYRNILLDIPIHCSLGVSAAAARGFTQFRLPRIIIVTGRDRSCHENIVRPPVSPRGFVHIHSLFLHEFKHRLFRRNRRDSTSLLHTQSCNCISQNSTLSDFFPFHFFNILIHGKYTA